MTHRTLIAASLLLAACGVSDANLTEEAESDDLYSQESTVIVGSVNWKSTTLLAPAGAEAKNARAVGYLSIPAKGTRCTAWLIAADKIVTNNHCISSAAQAVGARASFNYADGTSYSSRIWYDCSTFVKTWSDVDMTVLKCAARGGVLPGTTYGKVALASSNPGAGAALYVIHQNCDYFTSPGCSPTKKYSPGKVRTSSWWSKEITYDADTLGGSSGSAVFAADGSNAHKLVALHHLGFNGDSNGRGTHNGGVKVTALKSRLDDIGL